MSTSTEAAPPGAHVHQLKAALPAKRAADADRYEQLLRIREVEARTALRKSAIYDGQKRGTFPMAVCIGGRSVAWKASEIEAWIASRPAAGPRAQADAARSAA